MIYFSVDSMPDAQEDIVNFYHAVLCDEIETDSELTLPLNYLAEVTEDAKGQTDRVGNEIEKFIMKAVASPKTLKKIHAAYNEAKNKPVEFHFLNR